MNILNLSNNFRSMQGSRRILRSPCYTIWHCLIIYLLTHIWWRMSRIESRTCRIDWNPIALSFDGGFLWNKPQNIEHECCSVDEAVEYHRYDLKEFSFYYTWFRSAREFHWLRRTGYRTSLSVWSFLQALFLQFLVRLHFGRAQPTCKMSRNLHRSNIPGALWAHVWATIVTS